MVLKEVIFNNFKSFKNQKVIINNINIIIGKNNAGKSNLLEGLDLFFNFKKKRSDRDLDIFLYKNKSNKSTKLKFSIECLFKLNSKKIDIKPSNRVTQFFPINTKNEIRIRFVHNKTKGYNRSFYEVYNYSSNAFVSLSTIEFLKLFKNLDFLYIPAFRDFNNTKITEDVFEKIFDKTSVVRKNRIVKSLDDLKDEINKNIIEEFKETFNSLIDFDFFGRLSFDLRFNEDNKILIQNILKTYKPLLTDGVQTGVDEKGSGLQSFIIIWLYNYLATLSDKNLILAIEEPESHLHPTSQKNLMKGIAKIFKSQKNQIILSTHSPFLVDSANFTDVIYVRSANDGDGKVSEIRQIKSNSLNSDDINFFERNLSIEKKDIFFGDHVVLVEAVPDKLVFEYFLKLYNFDVNFENCSFIPVDGTPKFKYLVKLLELFKIPFINIFDRDFVYQKDKNGNDHYGFLNMCSYSNIHITPAQENYIKNNKDNISKLNKVLSSLNSISLTSDLEEDLMTTKTLPFFKKILGDNSITLDQIKKHKYKRDLIKSIIQNIAYEIKNKKDLPRYYQTLISFLLKNISKF